MNEKFSKLRQEQKQEVQQEQKEQLAKEQQFNSVEEMIKADASQIEVPVRVAERLNRSIAELAVPEKSWWKRILGK